MLVVHHHIRGVCRFEDCAHPHQIRVFELGEGAGFGDETFQAPLEVSAAVLRNRVNLMVSPTHHQLQQQVLLDGHLLIKIGIESQRGDPKPALAENFVNRVPVELVADG